MMPIEHTEKQADSLERNGIDAHQHFWNFDPVRDNWITEDMAVIREDFLPVTLYPLLRANGFEGSIAVQASQTEEETTFLLQLAAENDFIRGLVGWVDLQAPNITERLDYYWQYKIIKGFRHLLQGEAKRDLMLSPEFQRGIAALERYNFTYDLLILPDQLKFCTKLVTAFPHQKFIIDHLAKPPIKQKEIASWREDINAIAKHKNVSCKLSGMVTEGHWKLWKADDFTPYMDVVVEAFGVDRIVYGSDWPVCLVAATYGETVAIVKDYFASFSAAEQAKIFGKNATRFYNL